MLAQDKFSSGLVTNEFGETRGKVAIRPGVKQT